MPLPESSRVMTTLFARYEYFWRGCRQRLSGANRNFMHAQAPQTAATCSGVEQNPTRPGAQGSAQAFALECDAEATRQGTEIPSILHSVKHLKSLGRKPNRILWDSSHE